MIYPQQSVGVHAVHPASDTDTSKQRVNTLFTKYRLGKNPDLTGGFDGPTCMFSTFEENNTLKYASLCMLL